MQLSSANQVGVAMLEALEQFTKGIVGPAATKAASLVAGTEDSTTLARIHILLGDINYKRDNFAAALDSYLQVPVFYGAQASLLPAAELGAARCLVRLGRATDASEGLNRIIVRYAGSFAATEAEKDKVDVDKLVGANAEAKAKAAPAAEAK
jgi:TolA-binding protein